MAQAKKSQAAPATNADPENIHSTGERIGRLAGKAIVRVQRAAQGFREEADEMDSPEPSPQARKSKKSSKQHARTAPLPTDRAEVLVDHFLQRATHWAVVGNLQARRGIARLREDAEDMWVEAQDIRGSWGQKGRHV